MSQNEPGTIRIIETEAKEFAAKEVDLHVTVRGSSFFVGDAALTKAKEVSALVSELKRIGIDDDRIRLESVQSEVTSGIMGRNSSAAYALKITCRPIETLPEILGAITSQKNTKITHLRWEYGATREPEEAMLDLCIERANRKARRIASALGVTLLGIGDFAENVEDQNDRAYVYGQAAQLSEVMAQYGSRSDVVSSDISRSRARHITADDFGGTIVHSKRILVGVRITYRVSDIAAHTAESSNA